MNLAEWKIGLIFTFFLVRNTSWHILRRTIPHVPCKTTKLLQANLGLPFYDLGIGKDDLERAQKALNFKEKKKLLNKVKILQFCLSIDTVKKIKRQAMNWERTFATHISDRGLDSGICKEFIELHNKRTNNPIKNEQKVWTDTLSKKVYKWQISTCKDAQHLWRDISFLF